VVERISTVSGARKGTEAPMNATRAERKAIVAPARRLIAKPHDLIAQAEGRHVAVLALRFAARVFPGDDEPTPTVDVVVVDVDSDAPRPLAALTISWRRVVAALRLTEPGTWQIGRLVREAEFQAVELLEPERGLDLDRVAVQLGELQEAALPSQLAITDGAAEHDNVCEVHSDGGSGL
jgi:hypothetical protein